MSAVTTRELRLGTRGSALARAQSGLVAAALPDPVALVTIKTTGDRDRRPVEQVGGTGIFVSALRDALLAGEIDLAVHSYKDLPTAPADGLLTAAVPVREDPRDALVARDGLALAQLPAGARVGTGAARRVAQLRAHRPDLELVPIRGNVDTRLAMVADGRLDAVVVAASGLARLGRGAEITELLDPSICLPAPAQGALAVECRADDAALHAVLAGLDHASSRAAVDAERALLAACEAGCTAPIGAYATTHDNTIVLDAAVAAVDGSAVVRDQATGPLTEASRLGRQLAATLLAAGASDLLGRPR